jgi:hypothetical protein
VKLYSCYIDVKSMKRAICVIKHVKSECHWGASTGKIASQVFSIKFHHMRQLLMKDSISGSVQHYYWQFNFPRQ